MSLFYSAGLGSAIPDSTTSRVADNGTSSGVDKHGIAFTLSDSFSEVGFKISSNTGSGVTRAYLYNLDTSTPVTDVDITSLGAGDTFTISASYQKNTEYAVTLDAEGSTYSYGFNGSPSYPFTGSDVDIIAGVDGQSTKQSGFAYTIVSIGDP